MLKNILAAIAISVFMMGSVHAGSHGGAANQEAADAAIAEAKAAVKKAGTVGGVWRDTGKMIKKAEKLAADGKFDKAVKLAKKAARQGEYGYTQAVEQKGIGNPDYMHM
jgi:hypothetical protein